MAKTGTGVDFGASAVRLVSGRLKGGTLRLRRAVHESYAADPRTGEVKEPTDEAKDALALAEVKEKAVVLGVTGRDVMMRYTKAPAMSLFQLKNLMEFEVDEIAEKAGGDVASDYSILRIDEEGAGEATILVGLAKNRYLVPCLASLEEAGISVRYSCPNPLALFNAFLHFGDFRRGETTLLLDIGAENLDMAIQADGDLLFARSMSLGGRAFSEAVMGALSVSFEKAESLKRTKADVSRSTASVDQTGEKVSNSMAGVCGQLLSAIQSSVLFCRNQTGATDVRLDRIVLSGGGAALAGLPAFLTANLEVPVALFEYATGLDVSDLMDDEREMFEENGHLFVVAVGLVQMAVNDQCFRLEIVPEPVRKKRVLLERTSFLGIAGLVAVGVLGWKIWVGTQNLTEMKSRYRKLTTIEKIRTANAEKFDRLSLEVATLAEKLDVVADLANPGTALCRGLEVAQDHLPSDLWVRSIDVGFDDFVVNKSDDEEADDDRRSRRSKRSSSRKKASAKEGTVRMPVVRIVGEGRESVDDVQKTVNDFARAVRSDGRVHDSRLKYSAKTRTFEIEIIFFAPGPDETSDDNEDETEGREDDGA